MINHDGGWDDDEAGSMFYLGINDSDVRCPAELSN